MLLGHLYVIFGEMSTHDLCPYLIELFCCYCHYIVEDPYLFWILTTYQICNLQILSAFPQLLFHSEMQKFLRIHK
jgi:hypothetical protein